MTCLGDIIHGFCIGVGFWIAKVLIDAIVSLVRKPSA